MMWSSRRLMWAPFSRQIMWAPSSSMHGAPSLEQHRFLSTSLAWLGTICR